MKAKQYMGDAVYAEFVDDSGTLKLTTENGSGPASATIWIEPDVLRAIVNYATKETKTP